MDRVGSKIWELMQLGIYDGVCLAGVRLLQEAPWGAAAVEEGNASTTMLLRKHTYGDNTLRTRAALAQARPLFSQTRLFKRINLARQRLNRLRCKQPHRIKGRHMLLRDALKLAAKQKACGIHKDKHIGRRVIKAGNSLWKKANVRIRAEYDSSAAAVR